MFCDWYLESFKFHNIPYRTVVEIRARTFKICRAEVENIKILFKGESRKEYPNDPGARTGSHVYYTAFVSILVYFNLDSARCYVGFIRGKCV